MNVKCSNNNIIIEVIVYNNIILIRTRLVDADVSEKPVIEVFNQTPFVFKDRNFTSMSGERVFEIFDSDNSDKGYSIKNSILFNSLNVFAGFSIEVDPIDLPFSVKCIPL